MLSACDTYTSQQYQTSPQNVIELQQLSASGARASVGQVNLAENVEARPQCRLAGPLDLGGGNNVADTIKQAIQAEFLGGGLFSPNAKPINVTVTQLKPDSFAENWQLNFLVSSQSGRSFKVNSTTEFSTSFTAVSACITRQLLSIAPWERP